MGCWNGTCQVSGLSIFAGDEIVAIPLVLNRGEYQPLMRPVMGKYNDYGSIEDIEPNPHFDAYFKKALSMMVRTTETVEDEFGIDKPVEPTEGSIWLGPKAERALDHDGLPKDAEEFFKLLERQGCFDNVISLKGSSVYDDAWQPLHLCMILRSVYDWMITKAEFSSWFEESIEKAYSSIAPFLEVCKVKDEASFMATWEFSNKWSELVQAGEGLNLNSDVRLNHKFGEMTEAEIRDIFTDTINMRKFIAVFKQLRCVFTPPAMAGSQDDNLDLRLELCGLVTSHIAEAKKRFEEWEDDFESEGESE